MKTGAGVQQPKPSLRRAKRACDSCRVRKVKCSGTVPCTQCQSNNVLCIAQLRFLEKGEQKPLQRQMQYLLFERGRLTRALQTLYKQSLSGVPWQGEPVSEISSEGPSIHEILQRLEGDISIPTLPNDPIHNFEPALNLRCATNDRKVSDASEVPSMTDSERTTSNVFADPYSFCETMPSPILTPLIDPAYCISHLPNSDVSPPSSNHYGSFYQDNVNLPCLSYSPDVVNEDICTPLAKSYTQSVDFFTMAQLQRSYEDILRLIWVLLFGSGG